MSLRLLAILAGLCLSLAAGSAEAYPAYASASVNLRSGPATSYPIITTIPPGGAVDVHSCTAGWCDLNYAGARGWVVQTYVSGTAYAPPPPPPPPPYAYYPRPYYPYAYPRPYPYYPYRYYRWGY